MPLLNSCKTNLPALYSHRVQSSKGAGGLPAGVRHRVGSLPGQEMTAEGYLTVTFNAIMSAGKTQPVFPFGMARHYLQTWCLNGLLGFPVLF